MKRIEIGQCVVEIDDEATRAYYAAGNRINDCGCDECVNFRAYAADFPIRTKEFFASLGIDDMRVIAELCPYTHHDGSALIGGFYHLVGSMTGGHAPRRVTGLRDKLREFFGLGPRKRPENGDDTRLSGVMEIGEELTVFFKTPCDLMPRDFPENAVQMEISTTIPWVLDKKCPE